MADGRFRGAAIDILNEKLERAKESLHDVDENIRKFTGREFGERSMSVGGGGPGMRNRGARSGAMGTSRSAFERLGAPLAKRPNRGSAFSRLGNRVDIPGPRMGAGRRRRESLEDYDEELPHKPALSSSVVASSAITRTRKDSIEEQNQDTKGTARNRRMFGVLLGTLQKFKNDSGQKTEKEVHREEIEQKLDDRAKKEKQEIASERRELFTERKNKQKELERLEELMDVAKEQDMWDNHSVKLSGFIQTTAKPPLFYRPRKMLQNNNDKLSETQRKLAEMAVKRRANIEEEIRSFEGFGKEHAEKKSEKENEKKQERIEPEKDERKKRRDSERGRDGDKHKEREKRKDGERERKRDRGKDGERERKRDRGKDGERERKRDRSNDKECGKGKNRDDEKKQRKEKKETDVDKEKSPSKTEDLKENQSLNDSVDDGEVKMEESDDKREVRENLSKVEENDVEIKEQKVDLSSTDNEMAADVPETGIKMEEPNEQAEEMNIEGSAVEMTEAESPKENL